MASDKQIIFIESLLRKPENADYNNTPEAQAIRAGQGDNISSAQASRFISELLHEEKKAYVITAEEKLQKKNEQKERMRKQAELLNAEIERRKLEKNKKMEAKANV